MPVVPVAALTALPAPRLKLALDAVELRRGSVQPPAIADQQEDQGDGHEGGPEASLGSGGGPDDHADDKRRGRSARLLKEPALELVAALGQLSPQLLLAGRQRGQVAQQGLELLLCPGGVGGLHALVELLLGDPARGEMLAQRLGRLVAFVV